jgi:hypothetical protein
VLDPRAWLQQEVTIKKNKPAVTESSQLFMPEIPCQITSGVHIFTSWWQQKRQ